MVPLAFALSVRNDDMKSAGAFPIRRADTQILYYLFRVESRKNARRCMVARVKIYDGVWTVLRDSHIPERVAMSDTCLHTTSIRVRHKISNPNIVAQTMAMQIRGCAKSSNQRSSGAFALRAISSPSLISSSIGFLPLRTKKHALI
jgi:hypothetical protein